MININRKITFSIKRFVRLALLVLGVTMLFSCNETDKDYATEDSKLIWAQCGLKKELKFEVFNQAITGYKKIKGKRNSEFITIIDFSKPSTKERMYIVDLKSKRLVEKSLVAHGKNSGGNYAKYFSNSFESNKSCLGFFLTGNAYDGNFGRSLTIKGLEKNINDNAERRHIVIHPSKFVNQNTIKRRGMLSRSLGCAAIPEKEAQSIINKIKGGSCVFIYANNKDYKLNSKFVRET